MTERTVEPDFSGPDSVAHVGPTNTAPGRPAAVEEHSRLAPAQIALDDRLVGRFAEIAAGRILVIDYLVTRPSWSLPSAELSVRLQRTVPRGTRTIATIEGVPCVADLRLATVLREAGVRIRPVAGAVLGQFAIDLDRPLVWLDFLSSVPARQP